MKKLLPFLLGACCLLLAGPVAAQLTFVSRAVLPVAHYGMGYCNDQTAIYQVGGGNPTTAYTADVYRYDLLSNAWGSGTAVITPQRWGTAAILDPSLTTGLIYALNGQNANGNAVPVVESIYVASGQGGPSATNPQPTASAGSAVWNGILYCFGGSTLTASGTVYSNSLRSYNRLTNTWTILAPMPEAKETRGAAVNGKIYTFGGYNGVVNSSRVDVYDIATNTWQTLPALPTTVSNQAVAVQGELIWLVGDFTNQSYLAVYNTRTGQLRTLTSNLPPRRNAGAACVSNQLYVWGGNTAAANSSALGDLWRADVSTLLPTTAAAAPQVLQAYPNPSATGALRVVLPSAEATLLTVCDALGREVRRLPLPRGTTAYDLNLADQAAGLYLVRTAAEGQPPAVCRVVRQ